MTYQVGIVFSLLAALSWSISTLIYAKFGENQNPLILNFVKGVAGSLFLLATLLILGEYQFDSKTPGLLPLVLSGIIGIALGDSAFFLAMNRCGSTLTASLQCLTPPLVAFLAFLFLGESLDILQWIGIIVSSSCTVGLIYSKSNSYQQSHSFGKRSLRYGVFWAVLAALCQAIGILVAKDSLGHVTAFQGAFYRIFPSTVLLGCLVVMGMYLGRMTKIKVNIKRVSYPIQLCLASFVGTYLGLFFMTLGLKWSDAGISTALASSYPVWITLIQTLVFKEAFRPISWIYLAGSVGGIFLVV